jgi:hypothetical protein
MNIQSGFPVVQPLVTIQTQFDETGRGSSKLSIKWKDRELKDRELTINPTPDAKLLNRIEVLLYNKKGGKIIYGTDLRTLLNDIVGFLEK